MGDRATQHPVVMVVDDDERLLALVRLALQKHGIEVVTARSVGEAEDLVAGVPDLVILDIVLPDGSGWELLRHIRERGDLPVLLLSGRDSDVDKARGLELGADDYLTKPFSFLELEARVRALLRRRERASDLPAPAARPEPAVAGPARTVALVAELRHIDNQALQDAQATWLAEGCKVEVVVPDVAQLYDVPSRAPDWSVVVSRGRNLAGLGLLAAASALGVLAVNEPQAIDLVRNKIAMQAVLAEHGIPLPRTWFAGDPAVFADLPASRFPLVVKPYDGDGSRGVSLLLEGKDVELLPTIEGRRSLYLAQEYLDGDGYDLKLYGVGPRVWAVRKPAAVRFAGAGPAEVTGSTEAELVDLDPELTDIALTCGRACGLELWGVDVAMTRSGPRVIEVNDFPTYSAVPAAGEAIAEHVLNLLEVRGVRQAAGRDHFRSLVRT